VNDIEGKMQIMTRKYCERCPWFNATLGYLEPDDPTWTPEDKCACKDCKLRPECETSGPKDMLTCLLSTEGRFQQALEKNPDLEAKIRKRLNIPAAEVSR